MPLKRLIQRYVCARGGGTGAAPRCPRHNQELLVLTSRTAGNPDRKFYKCSHPTEAASCLPFAWVDEWQGPTMGVGPTPVRGDAASRGRTGRASATRSLGHGTPGRGGRHRGQGRRNSASNGQGGTYVMATGEQRSKFTMLCAKAQSECCLKAGSWLRKPMP